MKISLTWIWKRKPTQSPIPYLLAGLFVASTWMDVLTAYLFMGGKPRPELEANPLAAWVIHHHGFCGLAWCVIALDLFVIGVLIKAWHTKQKLAFTGFAVACVASNAVVIHNLVMLCSMLSP